MSYYTEVVLAAAASVGLAVTILDGGRYSLKYADKPEMSPLVMSKIEDVQLLVLAEDDAQRGFARRG